MVAYKRWSIPISVFILTIIGVAVSSMKRRGGIGINLTLGIALTFGSIFIDKVLGTLAVQADFEPWVVVWLLNIVLGFLAAHLLLVANNKMHIYFKSFCALSG